MRSAVAMSSARWECCRHGISRSSTRHSASDIRSESRSSAGFAAQDAYQGQLKLVGDPFSEEKYGVGLPKGSERCEDINAAITKMIDEGAWEEAINSNTEGADYSFDAELNPPEPEPCA